ncbi:response regulator [Streptomyces ipomoeae]|jgi:DNA-binding NarL/FixJ family response regulator|uniref:Response regulator n=1 Tax=Streptomyces ipomoeae TaxID=103232 RepID=A0AAE8W3P8_9ACTN|nr:response regulator transcription factor [Streptomyces ipomoeae]MDX2821836.1 response regulator transcription factor [Streptomyces ipomoeae]MDX2873038.1 response regulator transcription factor [Streptomyces ipomoeae]TQE23084.1 response regulator [Streptomyces ipomoeae]TQE32470.1 response regulator [Streptomyces ipomoeae]
MSMRCLIVDDSARFLEAARTLLERDGIRVVGVASTGAEALARAVELAPDVVLLDIDLNGESGLELAPRLARTASSIIILTSTHSLDDIQELVAASPARGFLHKSKLSGQALRDLLGPDPRPPAHRGF